MTGSLTITDGAVYFLHSGVAGDADSAAAAATAFNDAAIWDDTAAATAWVVISDDNSSAIYEWSNVASSSNELAVGELALVGTVNTVLAGADFLFS